GARSASMDRVGVVTAEARDERKRPGARLGCAGPPRCELVEQRLPQGLREITLERRDGLLGAGVKREEQRAEREELPGIHRLVQPQRVVIEADAFSRIERHRERKRTRLVE